MSDTRPKLKLERGTTMMMHTIVISAGRNILTQPMSADRWQQFHESIEYHLDFAIATYFTKRAIGGGNYEGMSEESVTYVVGVLDIAIPKLERELAKLADIFKQDSIAFMMVSQTKFLSGERVE